MVSKTFQKLYPRRREMTQFFIILSVFVVFSNNSNEKVNSLVFRVKCNTLTSCATSGRGWTGGDCYLKDDDWSRVFGEFCDKGGHLTICFLT